MTYTRRDTHTLLLASLASTVGVPLCAAEDWPARVQAGLDALLPPDDLSYLTLSSFEVERSNDLRVTAVVDLTWPPGFRRRAFCATGRTEAAAVDQLLLDVAGAFAAALPGRLA